MDKINLMKSSLISPFWTLIQTTSNLGNFVRSINGQLMEGPSGKDWHTESNHTGGVEGLKEEGLVENKIARFRFRCRNILERDCFNFILE